MVLYPAAAAAAAAFAFAFDNDVFVMGVGNGGVVGDGGETRHVVVAMPSSNLGKHGSFGQDDGYYRLLF